MWSIPPIVDTGLVDITGGTKARTLASALGTESMYNVPFVIRRVSTVQVRGGRRARRQLWSFRDAGLAPKTYR